MLGTTTAPTTTTLAARITNTERMIGARAMRVRASTASTIGSSERATNSATTTRRTTPRICQVRYRTTAQTTTMATIRTTPFSDGAASRSGGASPTAAGARCRGDATLM